MKLQNPHDKFFKETLGNVETAKDFITNYFPKQVLQVLDINTLEPQKDSFINQELEENFSDLLFKVDICNKEGYLYLLFEHKSYPDKGISFQLLKYMVEIWEAKRNKERPKELPIIIPLVIYHGQQSWTMSTSLGEFLNGYDQLPEEVKVYVPNFDYLLYDISRYSDEEIKGTAQLKILLTLFRDLITEDLEKRDQAIYRSIYHLNELENKQTAVGYLETMLRYIFTVAKKLKKADVDRIVQQLEINNIDGGELAMTLAEMWREEGMEKGIEKGIEVGGAKALANMAIIQLTSKLGALPQDLKDAISKADLPTLQVILTNIFNIQNINDVKRYIQ